MANNNSPFGFTASIVQMEENRYATYTVTSGYGTSLYAGDPVTVSGGVGGAANLTITAAPGDYINGFFKGVEYSDASGFRRRQNFWTAGTVGTNIIAYVTDEPFGRFKVQMSGAFTDAAIGQLADFVAGTGNPVSLSGYALDSTTIGTGTGFLILDVLQVATNEDGSEYAIVEVMPVKHNYRLPG